MAYTVDILNAKKVEGNGLLSKIEIGGKVYEIKDLIARENIGTLSAGLDAIAADLAAKHKALTDEDAAIREYVDAQVGAINKFDVRVMAEGEELPTASAETMYVLYLKPDANAASGAYLEYITVRSGAEGAYTYAWEQIGSTEMDVTGFVTETALNKALEPYAKTADVEADIKEVTDSLGALAHKNDATGTVAGQTVSGVKATGTTTGDIVVELQATEKEVASTGKYTPAGDVTGTVTIPEHNVPVALTGNDVAATVATGTGTTQATVRFTPANTNVVTSATQGTQASFSEGKFTAATLGYEAVEREYATEGIVGSVTDECLTFSAAGTLALAASKINSFDGGSKAADTFIANSLPEFGTGSALASISDATATVEYEKVTSVTYHKVEGATATCAGDVIDITATFAGTEGDINVKGAANDYAVKTADFNGASIELAVGDIVVAAQDVTVS